MILFHPVLPEAELIILKFHHLKLADICSLPVCLFRLSVLGNGASAE